MINRYVNTASTAGGDGTTNDTSGANRAWATLWEGINALNGTTLTDDLTIWCEGSAADTSNVGSIDVNASSYTLYIKTAADKRHAGVWNTSKYRIESSGPTGVIRNNTTLRLVIEGLQIKVTADNVYGMKLLGANHDGSFAVRYSHNLVWMTSTTGTVGIGCDAPAGGSGTAVAYNNMIYGGYVGVSGLAGSWFQSINNTVRGCTYGYVADAAWTVKNSLASGCTIGFVGSFAAASNYNAEDDGNGAPGANSRSGVTFTFIDTGSSNFHLSSTDAGARDYGNSSIVGGLFSDDIDGQTRSGTWDIGADEYVVQPTGYGSLIALPSTITGDALIPGFPAYGYATAPAGESPQSWLTWHLGRGAVVVNDEFGTLIVPSGVACDSPVVDMGDATSKQITLSTKYGTNSGVYTRYIRGSDSAFAWNDVSPEWTAYTGAVTQAWRYVQTRIVGG